MAHGSEDSENVYLSDAITGESLSHHGVAGQKWGVRKGPPYPLVSGGKNIHLNVGKMTDKTKAKYSSAKGAFKNWKTKRSESKSEAKANISDVGPKKFAKSKQRISEMSSTELQARISRLKLEAEYKKYLNGDGSSVQNVLRGRNKADSILHNIGKEVLVGFAKLGVDRIREKQLARIRLHNSKRQARADAIAEANKQAAIEYKKALAKDRADAKIAENKKERAEKEAKTARQERNNVYMRQAAGIHQARQYNYNRTIGLGKSALDAALSPENYTPGYQNPVNPVDYNYWRAYY